MTHRIPTTTGGTGLVPIDDGVAEAVLPGHPDKLCDRIADGIVDAARARHPRALVGIEVALYRSTVFLTGAVFTTPPLDRDDLEAIVRTTLAETGYGPQWPPEPAKVRIDADLLLLPLTEDVEALRTLADDQAVCIGWAGGRRADRYLPKAHRLAWLAAQALDAARRRYGLGPDGKVIVAVEDGRVSMLTMSIYHGDDLPRRRLWAIADEVARAVGVEDRHAVDVRVNPYVDFTVGGPMGDNGLSGKKLVFDAYGPSVPIGGGALSGKDPWKIDRVGTLRARQAALRAIRLGLGTQALVTLAWAPGASRPARVDLVVDGKPVPAKFLGPFDFSIEGSVQALGLEAVSFAPYADGSWFQRPAPWEFDAAHPTAVAHATGGGR